MGCMSFDRTNITTLYWLFFNSVTYDSAGTAKVKALWITFIKQLRLSKLILQQLSPTSIWLRGGRLGY